jgi:hypothetical protein
MVSFRFLVRHVSYFFTFGGGKKFQKTGDFFVARDFSPQFFGMNETSTSNLKVAAAKRVTNGERAIVRLFAVCPKQDSQLQFR